MTSVTNRRVSLAFPIIFLLLLIGIIIVYGFLSVYYNEVSFVTTNGTTTTTQNPKRAVRNTCLLIMDTLFTLLGFGLLLSPYKHQKWAGMSIALFVVSFNIIFGLLFQDMWFEIFFGFRQYSTETNSTLGKNAFEFWNKHSNVGKSTASFYSFRLSNLCSTSYLVGMTAFSGRVTFSNIAFSLPIFCFLYYLNMYLNMLACFNTNNKTDSFSYLDAYGTILIYLFGGVYGMIVGFFTKSPVETQEQIEKARKSRVSLTLSVIGSFFILATFCLSYTNLLTRAIDVQRYARFNNGAILVNFGIAAGIMGYYVTALLAGKGKANLEGVIISTITGGIMVGGLADVIQTIGASLLIGFIAGCVSGLFNTLVTPKMNEKSVTDSQGLLGPILIVAILASFVVHPSVLHQFYIRNTTLTPTGLGYGQTDWRVARYHLVYFGITFGIAAGTGIILGLIYKIKRNFERDFFDEKFFADDYGLYDYKNESAYLPQVQGSASNLKEATPVA